MKTKKRLTGKLLSVLLALAMVCTMLPMTPFATEIKTENLTMSEPVVGAPNSSVTFAWSSGSSSGISQPTWYIVGSGSGAFNFQAGKTYKVSLILTLTSDDTFASNASITINGEPTEIVSRSSATSIIVSYTFTMPSTHTVTTVSNQNTTVGNAINIPWPDGADFFQLYEAGGTSIYEGAKTTYPSGMYIPAQSSATTKTYYFKVHFPSDQSEWVQSNEFTVTWSNSAHNITVTGGTANPTSAVAGTEITLTPSAAPSGLVFDKWEVVSGDVTITGNKFTMPDNNVVVKAKYKVSVSDQITTVRSDVFIPWPDGAEEFMLYEAGGAMLYDGEKKGYPEGMQILAQSSATTKTYYFKVLFPGNPGEWIQSNEFTVTWSNSAHNITVTGGTANPTSAVAGTEITLTPSAAPSGLVFDKWEVVSGDVTITGNKFTMPDNNVVVKAKYKVSVSDQNTTVGNAINIPWPEGAEEFMLYEAGGTTIISGGEKTGYPEGMYIPAQSSATTKTYYFEVLFPGEWIQSNEFTVTWANPVTITTQPVSISGEPGDTLNVSVEADNAASYMWHVKDVATGIEIPEAYATTFFKNVPNYSSKTLSIKLNVNGTLEVWCVVTGIGGDMVISDTVRMKFGGPAKIVVPGGNNFTYTYNEEATEIRIELPTPNPVTGATWQAAKSSIKDITTDLTSVFASDKYTVVTGYAISNNNGVSGLYKNPYISITPKNGASLQELSGRLLYCSVTGMDGATSSQKIAIAKLQYQGTPVGVTVSGTAKSYNPNNETTVTLYVAGDRTTPVKTATIPASTGSGQTTQNFSITTVTAGTYDLVVTKPGHLAYTITNVAVDSSDIDLSAAVGKEYQSITLLAGDVNGDEKINLNDLNMVWKPENYLKTPGDVGVENITDIDGNGKINLDDLNLIRKPEHYLKTVSNCIFEY